MAVADVAAAVVPIAVAVAVGDVAGVLDFAWPQCNMLKHW